MEADNLRPTTIECYTYAIRNLRKAFPGTTGPADISDDMAARYKVIRSKKVKPTTVAGNINKLTVVWSKWFIKKCKIVTSNPFAEVDQPRLDKREKRVLDSGEMALLLDWMQERWNGWRLPVLFLEVTAAIGCRVREIAFLKPQQLEKGRVVLVSEGCKGRKTRRSKLRRDLYRDLKGICGKQFVFEHFSKELRQFHIRRGKPQHARMVKEFRPDKIVGWIQDEIQVFRATHPEIKYFKLHNFRGTAMSKARAKGVSYDDAAIAFGCHPETMRKHYIQLDEIPISDDVMDRIQAVDSTAGDDSD